MTQHDLDAIIQSGETDTVEFKRNVNSDISKELVAFANSSGGRVFIGIEDDGMVHGVQVTNELKSRIQSIARDCDPAVLVELDVFNNILIINVPEGKNKPYRCATGFYMRSGASSSKLSTDDIIEFMQSEGKVRFDELLAPSVSYPAVLNEEAFSRYLRLAGISGVIGRDEILTNLGVLKDDGSGPVLNNAGVLFFAKQPTRVLPHCIVDCLLFKGASKVYILDRKIFEFDLLTNIDEALIFVERHLNLAYEIKEVRRKEILEIPKFVLREAIINAVEHRDYFERGAKVQIDIFDDRVEISNPGGLPKGLKPENFGKRSVTRNALIASLLHRCNYIESGGTGIQRMRDGMKEAGLLEPRFHFSGFFSIILPRIKIVEKKAKDEMEVSGKRMQRMLIIVKNLRDGAPLDVASLSGQLNTTDRTIRRDLEALERLGWIKSTGVTRNTQYSLTVEGLNRINDSDKSEMSEFPNSD